MRRHNSLIAMFSDKSMTNARLMLMACAALIGGLITAGAGLMGQAVIHHENPPRASQPGQEPPFVQSAPGAIAAKPSADQGPLAIQVDVVDPEGRRLPGVDVLVRLSYPRSSGNAEPVIERSRTDGAGHVQFEVVREQPGGDPSVCTRLGVSTRPCSCDVQRVTDWKSVPSRDPTDPE